jgi:hypothetical protein
MLNKSDYDIDYDNAILKQSKGRIHAGLQVKQNREEFIQDFNTYSFNDKTFNHLTSISQFIETLINNQEINHENKEIILHTLQIAYANMGVHR